MVEKNNNCPTRLVGHNHFPEPAGGKPDFRVCSKQEKVENESKPAIDAHHVKYRYVYIHLDKNHTVENYLD